MKRIEAIIRRDKVSDVCDALAQTGHPGITISLVEGRGRQKAWTNYVRGTTRAVSVLARARLEVFTSDEDAPVIIKTIREAAFTGEVGDGRIFVHDLADAIRIRTNESGLAAL